MVFSGRNTRSTRSDLIDVRFFPAPLDAASPSVLEQNQSHLADSLHSRVGLTYRILIMIIKQ